MAERRVCRSHPDFEELFTLASDLAMAVNPQRWFNLSGEKMDVAEPERKAVVAAIEAQLEGKLVEKGESFTAFVDFIKSLEL